MTSGEKIKAARKAAGMTQKQLGEKLGLTYQSIAQWETSLRSPKPENLKKIADAIGVNPMDLCDDRTIEIFKRLDAEFMEARQASEETLLEEQLADAAEIDIWQRLDDQGRKLFSAFYDLNDKGQEAAIDYVQYLAEQEKYLK